MIEIKDLLIKFNNLIFLENLKINIIKKVFLDVLNLKLENKDIKIKNNILYLNTKPIYKNEIFIKKNLILLKLKESLKEKSPHNII